MYDYVKMQKAFKKYVLDFQPDAHSGAMGAPGGKSFDILDYKLYKCQDTVFPTAFLPGCRRGVDEAGGIRYSNTGSIPVFPELFPATYFR